MQRLCLSGGHNTPQNFTEALTFQAGQILKEAPLSSYCETNAPPGEDTHVQTYGRRFQDGSAGIGPRCGVMTSKQLSRDREGKKLSVH